MIFWSHLVLKLQGGQEGLLYSINKYVLWAWILTGTIMRAGQIKTPDSWVHILLGDVGANKQINIHMQLVSRGLGWVMVERVCFFIWWWSCLTSLASDVGRWEGLKDIPFTGTYKGRGGMKEFDAFWNFWKVSVSGSRWSWRCVGVQVMCGFVSFGSQCTNCREQGSNTKVGVMKPKHKLRTGLVSPVAVEAEKWSCLRHTISTFLMFAITL